MGEGGVGAVFYDNTSKLKGFARDCPGRSLPWLCKMQTSAETGRKCRAAFLSAINSNITGVELNIGIRNTLHLGVSDELIFGFISHCLLWFTQGVSHRAH